MAHKIVQAIIENGKIECVDETLPSGKLRVHLIYDTEEQNPEKWSAAQALTETSGIYNDVNGDTEAKELRSQWERGLGG
jgi:hypothetical protein